MRSLWPPIEVIESNLQNGADIPLQHTDKEELAVPDHAIDMNGEMPAFIRDKIRQRVASRMAHFDTSPKAGQIWRFDGEQDSTAPLYVLLDHPLEGSYWQGWLVAAETDYATHHDVLLEPKDEPFDPVAGMVQTWNPVRVDISKGSRVLAVLAEHRLNAIREVASGQCETDKVARPGFVAPLKTQSGATILAGTCITHPADPRHRYQSLYRTAAEALEQQHSPIQKSAYVISLAARRQRLWPTVGWALAASVVLAQAAIIANLMRGQPDKSIEEQINQATEYRATPVPPASYSYLEVYFKPDSKEIDIRKLLTKLHATIVDGPGEFGQYRLKVRSSTEQEAVQNLRESGLADSVAQSTQ